MSSDPSDQLRQKVGMKLRAARLARKYTQNQLAHPDFSVSYISAIERGQIQPSLRALDILAKRLNLTTADLLPHPEQLALELAQRAGESFLVSGQRDLLLLEAQIVLRQGHPEEALDLLQILVAQKGNKDQELALLHLLGWAYLESGALRESEEALDQAVKLARELGGTRHPHILYLL